jgi:hypothetical protein
MWAKGLETSYHMEIGILDEKFRGHCRMRSGFYEIKLLLKSLKPEGEPPSLEAMCQILHAHGCEGSGLKQRRY